MKIAVGNGAGNKKHVQDSASDCCRNANIVGLGFQVTERRVSLLVEVDCEPSLGI